MEFEMPVMINFIRIKGCESTIPISELDFDEFSAWAKEYVDALCAHWKKRRASKQVTAHNTGCVDTVPEPGTQIKPCKNSLCVNKKRSD